MNMDSDGVQCQIFLLQCKTAISKPENQTVALWLCDSVLTRLPSMPQQLTTLH